MAEWEFSGMGHSKWEMEVALPFPPAKSSLALPPWVIVPPLATFALVLCAVGDTVLKSGWVRCRHGAGWGGAMEQFFVS